MRADVGVPLKGRASIPLRVPTPSGPSFPFSHTAVRSLPVAEWSGRGRMAAALRRPLPCQAPPTQGARTDRLPPVACRLREGANREILGIIVSYKVKVKLVVSRGG